MGTRLGELKAEYEQANDETKATIRRTIAGELLALKGLRQGTGRETLDLLARVEPSHAPATAFWRKELFERPSVG